MYDSRIVANEFLRLATESSAALTPMQLIKLVYIAHGWSLGLSGKPLIADPVQAWQYGPVIPKLYHVIKDFRGNHVSTQIVGTPRSTLREYDRALIQRVFDLYGTMTGMELSRITHAPGSPWSQVYEPNSFGVPIPQDLIEHHYRNILS